MELQEILLTAFGTLITGLFAWLTTFLTNWLSSKIKDKKIATMLTTINECVTNAVQATYQTYVEALKGTNMWTEEAQKEALNRALITAKGQLSENVITFIEENYGNVEEYLETLIESILYQLKNN